MEKILMLVHLLDGECLDNIKMFGRKNIIVRIKIMLFEFWKNDTFAVPSTGTPWELFYL